MDLGAWDKWLLAAAVAAGVTFIFWLLKKLLVSRVSKLASRTVTRFDDALIALLDETKIPFFLAVGLYFGAQTVDLPKKTEAAMHGLFLLVVFYQLGVWLSGAIAFLAEDYGKRSNDAGKATTLSALSFLGKLAIWVTVALLFLDNLGVNVSALVTGLGIGGVAIALAVQNVLGDLFASLSIVFDKPFVIGDSISVGNDSGTVEHIGLKTTRLKSSTGEQLIFSNSDLLKSRIRNFKRMQERFVSFRVSVPYETPSEKLRLAPELARQVIATVPGTRFVRCFLASFGANALELSVEYYVKSPDYEDYVQKHHAVSLALLDVFRRESIRFATQENRPFREGARLEN